ncbi:MAG TPA: sigma 54-interacting transcriptional regulator [Chitinophagaceae bacterium]
MSENEKKIIENNLLSIISEATSGFTGHDFLVELPKKLARLLKMKYCFIAECTDPGKERLRTIVFVEGETVLDNIEYNTNESACQMLMKGEPYFMPACVQQYFSGAKGIEAYMGVPIISPSTGEMLGHIAVTDPNPVTEEKNHIALLKIFASRIAAELERMKAERQLEEKNEEIRNRLKEIEFYHFTFENLREALFWLGEDGYIWQVNNKTCELTGYSKDELLKMHVFDLNKSINTGNWQQIWDKLKAEKKVVREAMLQCKDGTMKEIEITQNYIEFEGKAYTCSIVRDIRQKKLEENFLRTISERTAGLTGEDYFVELAKYITATLDVRYSFVVQCVNDDKTRLRMLSYVDRQEVKEFIEYDTKGTPCEIVMEGREFFCSNNLEQKFPREKGIQSWLAVPVYSPSTGKVIGNIAAFDRIPMREDQNQTAILRIFAARAGAELDRIEAERKLQKANEELKLRLKEIEQLKNQLAAENKYLQEEIKLSYNFDEIVSHSLKFKKVLRHIEQVAATDATVLILGESGTGKELLARAVHNISNRSKRPLVKVNCAALPANLIESELFGHEKGAFTGALERKIGRFELADGGTVFLDEIGELPVELQAKLLRILQEGEFERLGNPKTMKVNVRIIAATNRNLEQAIEKKEFREDLYYRLNVFPIHCLPLRERKEDIPLLVKHFCQKYEAKIGKKITNIPQKAMDALMKYDWPGNIRELENIMERALILSSGNTLEYGEWIPSEKKTDKKISFTTLEDAERKHIVDALEKTGWKVSGEKGAARILGLNATTLEARMKKLGIKRPVRIV